MEWQRQLRARDALQRILAGRLRREFDRVAREAPTRGQVSQDFLALHAERLNRILRPTALEIARQGSKYAVGRLSKGLIGIEKKVLEEDDLDETLLAWAKEHSAESVVDIATSTKRKINRAIVRGIERNDTPADIARSIRKSVGMSASRAETIARTETAIAYNVGQDEAMTEASSEFGVAMSKVWLASNDMRTRETHRAANDQTVSMDDMFAVGDSQLSFPSDPDGDPEEIINCRCGIIYEVRS